MIKSKVVEINTAEHSIVVRYYSDVITEEMLATDILDGVIRRCRTDMSIDVPLPAPTGDALTALIDQSAPKKWLETQAALLDATLDTSLAEFQALLNVEKVIAEPAPQVTSGVQTF